MLFLCFGMLSAPIATATKVPTYIEIEPSNHYNPDTNIYTSYMTNMGDNDHDFVVRAKRTDNNNIATDDIVFELWERPNSDVNHNCIYGEKLYETGGITHHNDRRWTNFANWFFASENIPKVYRTKAEAPYLEDLDAIPPANLDSDTNYIVKIKYRGSGIYTPSEKSIELKMVENRIPVHINIISESYSEDTGIFTTNRRALNAQFNLAAKTIYDTDQYIRNTLYFNLWERKNSDLNGNGIKGERLYMEADDAGTQSYCQVNVASWFKDIDGVKNLPNGQYVIRINSPGERYFRASEKVIFLDMGP